MDRPQALVWVKHTCDYADSWKHFACRSHGATISRQAKVHLGSWNTSLCICLYSSSNVPGRLCGIACGVSRAVVAILDAATACLTTTMGKQRSLCMSCGFVAQRLRQRHDMGPRDGEGKGGLGGGGSPSHIYFGPYFSGNEPSCMRQACMCLLCVKESMQMVWSKSCSSILF